MADLTWWCIFIHLTTRPSTDGKRAPLTAISLQAVGSAKEAPPTYIAKMWLLKTIRKNVIFSQNHRETNSDDWTITKKTTRTIQHKNFSKMKILKVHRWALSLRTSRITWLWWRHQMETFSALLAICAGSPVNSPHKGQWRGALMFSLICVWINGWVNNCNTIRVSRDHFLGIWEHKIPNMKNNMNNNKASNPIMHANTWA